MPLVIESIIDYIEYDQINWKRAIIDPIIDYIE